MERIYVTIVGAGVVGLSIAERLSRGLQDILLIERHASFGQETSSRNSEVIHAGIYYPKDSLKAKACIEGRQLLYEYCRNNHIPHKKTGKLIVALNKEEENDLEALFRQGRDNGVEDLGLITGVQAKGLEPNINARAAIFSPSTGIIDTHALMKDLAARFKGRGGQIAYNTQLTHIDRGAQGYALTVKDGSGEDFKFSSRILVNCAGLDSDKISAMAGLEKEEYKLKYCKGNYFRICSRKSKMVSRLVYPVPKKKGAGLGIHATPDLAGSLRLGPDDEYIKDLNYDVDPGKAASFYENVKDFLPFIELNDLAADTSGIRPKLQGEGEDVRDFLIREESASGFGGLINLIGIESPGLTASMAIAEMVRNYLCRTG